MLSNPDHHRIAQRLRDVGISPTLQRMVVAITVLPRPVHMTVEQVLRRARDQMPEISRATVYNTLHLFTRHGLLHELYLDGEAAVYDSNVAPHPHLYDLDTGLVSDLPPDAVQIGSLPALPAGVTLDSVDVVLRVRSKASDPVYRA